MSNTIRHSAEPSTGSASPDLTLDEALDALSAAQMALDDIRTGLREAASPVIEAGANANPERRRLATSAYRDARAQLAAQSRSLPDSARLLLSDDCDDVAVPMRGAIYRIGPFALEGAVFLPDPVTTLMSESETASVLAAIDAAFEKVDRAAARFRQDMKFLTMRKAHGGSGMLSSFEGRSILR